MIRSPFGVLPDGRPVDRFELTNLNGVEVRILDFGAIVQSIRVPDRNGKVANVVLGCEDPRGYLAQSDYLGAIIGRSASRTAGARFQLDGKTYSLTANEGSHHLHGGRQGFDKVLWSAAASGEPNSETLVLEHESGNGEEGYPGTLRVRVTYRLTDANDPEAPTPIGIRPGDPALHGRAESASIPIDNPATRAAPKLAHDLPLHDRLCRPKIGLVA